MAAQQPASAGRWVVDWGDHYCSLVRSSGGGDATGFLLRMTPGSSYAQLVTLQPRRAPGAVEPGRPVDIVLNPGGARFSSAVMRNFTTPSGAEGTDTEAIEGLLEQFAAATSVEVVAGDQVQFRMSFPLARDAVAALQSCENDALREWGVDPAALAGLRARPRFIGPAVTYADYPPAAVQAREEGSVLMRLIVEPDGSVSECVRRAEQRLRRARSGELRILSRQGALPARAGRRRPAGQGAPDRANRWNLAEY